MAGDKDDHVARIVPKQSILAGLPRFAPGVRLQKIKDGFFSFCQRFHHQELNQILAKHI
jgi:hypothetical protein